jgi:hypothetical protein
MQRGEKQILRQSSNRRCENVAVAESRSECGFQRVHHTDRHYQRTVVAFPFMGIIDIARQTWFATYFSNQRLPSWMPGGKRILVTGRVDNMSKIIRNTLVLTAVVGLLTTFAAAQAASQSAVVTLNGTVSSYVEIRAGGNPTLTNNVGGGVLTARAKGDPLTNTINLGELGPSNPNSFVYTDIPIRLRSNITYSLAMSTGGLVNADADAVQGTDIGFGVMSVARDVGGGVNAAGVDTPNAAYLGDPIAGATLVNGRYTYPAHVDNFAVSDTLVSGDRIMSASAPTGSPNGLVVTTRFAVAPSYYSAGGFSVPVTYTISGP